MRRIAVSILGMVLLAKAASADPSGQSRYRVTLAMSSDVDSEATAERLVVICGCRREPYAELGFNGFVVTASASAAHVLRMDRRVARVEELTDDRPAPATVTAPQPVQSVAEERRQVRVQAEAARPAFVPTADADATPWQTGTYAYDGSGNIKNIGSDLYRYDGYGRVTRADAGGQTQTFTYDRYGNITSISTSGVGTKSLLPDAATNRVQSNGPSMSVSYDAAGRLLTMKGASPTFTGTDSFTYDATEVVVESTVENVRRVYLYSPTDERIVAFTVANNTLAASEWTIRDTGGKVLRRLNRSASGNWSWVEDDIYRDSQLLAAEVAGRDRTLHFHADHLGTPRLITNHAGAKVAFHTYDAFGLEVTNPNQDTERLKFTGHERDAAHVDYMHARYYTPGWGRFLSVDPAMDLEKTTHEPQLWNRYSYVGNNPLKFNDPDGRERLAYWHFNRQPVPDRGFTTEMIETSKTAAWFGGALVGPALVAEGALEAGLFIMRNPSTVLATMKLLDSFGDGASSHINTTGLTGGKHGYLLDNATKSGFFRGVMGLSEKTIGGAFRSHFADNFAKNSKFNEKGLLEVTGRMVDAKGRAWSVTSVWKWAEKTRTWDLVTADNFRQLK